jgi:hypothetical protein
MSTIKTTTLSTLDGTATVPVNTVVNGSAKAWVNFNGTGTVAIRGSFNVSSITDNGTGQYTLNFTSAMQDLNYATIGSAWYSGVTGILFSIESTPSSTTSKSITTNNPAGTSNSDATYISVAIFR